MEQMQTLRERLEMRLEAGGGGEFEVLAISAGEGNGWHFSADVLRRSLPLWEGVETFIDHGESAAGGSRSVRDLAGVCGAAAFDETLQGVRLRLRASGPAGALLEAAGREWLASPEPRPRLGFSADLVFSARVEQPRLPREVAAIVRVLSLDLVLNPARGGMFLRALPANNLAQLESKGDRMDDNQQSLTPAAAVQEKITLSEQSPASVLSELLLETRLTAAALPQPVSEMLRGQFAGRTFRLAELDAAIAAAGEMVSRLTGARAVAGLPGGASISGMITEEERLQAATDDLLGAPREPNMLGKRVPRLTGIRELYVTLTGDDELRGGYDPARVRVRLANTTSLASLVKNALNKVIANTWEELGRAGYNWWQPLVQVEHFDSLQPVTGILVGEVGALPAVAESGSYGALNIEDSEETGSWTKYGGYLPLTLELIDRDDTHSLRQYPRKLAAASLRRVSALVGEVFTSGSGCGPLMADSYRVFDAAHHANLASGSTAALSSSTWEAASAAIYNQPLLVYAGETAPKQALDAKYLVVPRALRLTGMRILYPSFEREANYFSENMQRGEMGDVITCPEFSSASNWAAVADPRLAPGIIIGERFGLSPEIFVAGSEFDQGLFVNDEVRLKIRHFLSVFVADYRPLYKANVS